MSETTTSIQIVCPHCSVVNRVPEARLGEAPRCGKCHEALFLGRPLDLDPAGFERHLRRSDLPLLVDFWAPWCGPCRAMAPAFSEAAAQLEPRVRFAKVNTQDFPDVSAGLGIQGIPTMILFQGGQELARRSGAIGAREIVNWAGAQV